MGYRQQNSGESSRVHKIAKDQKTLLKITPNVLPCRVNHNGPVNATGRYWDVREEGGTLVTYFRGRKLLGTRLKLSRGYRGVVLRKTERIMKDDTLKQEAMQVLESKRTELDPADYAEEEDELRSALARGELNSEPIDAVEEIGSFDDITIWGHDMLPDRTENLFVRGMDEWLAFAQAVRRTANPDSR